MTNQLHEMELSLVVAASTGTPGPLSNNNGPSHVFGVDSPKVAKKFTSNGLSFDSDKFEFREFVDVACQANAGSNLGSANPTMSEKDRESLQDTVTAYEMQNRFLNKEVLELNQLRQHANDREQKLFM